MERVIPINSDTHSEDVLGDVMNSTPKNQPSIPDPPPSINVDAGAYKGRLVESAVLSPTIIGESDNDIGAQQRLMSQKSFMEVCPLCYFSSCCYAPLLLPNGK